MGFGLDAAVKAAVSRNSTAPSAVFALGAADLVTVLLESVAFKSRNCTAPSAVGVVSLFRFSSGAAKVVLSAEAAAAKKV
jgi:hypothetical protein